MVKDAGTKKPKLTLGPLFYNWSAAAWRDFYFKIADEADFDTVYLGEVVCSKREPFYRAEQPDVVARLKAAGKEVVFSTLALVTSEKEMEEIGTLAESGVLVEANDVAALKVLAGKPFIVGPFINVLNEGAFDFVRREGAVRVAFATEMTAAAMGFVAAQAENVETEVQVFGRQPLAVAMRCYHARAYGRNKDSCRIACAQDPEGVPLKTLAGEDFLTVNGTQLLSRGYVVLMAEMKKLSEQGVTHFRLSPQPLDMEAVVRLYRGVLEERFASDEAEQKLHEITGLVPFVNGFQYAKPGLDWVEDRGDFAPAH